MSEQEKKSSGNITGGSSVVMVEQTTASRLKQPYRPTELQEETLPDVQHKRSRAPAVPSISSDKQKQNIGKKLSLSTKRRGASPEAITLAPMEVGYKRDLPQHMPQPIPAGVGAVASEASSPTGADKVNEKNDDDDSITEEIAELRTSEVAKKSSEWNKGANKASGSDGLEDSIKTVFSGNEAKVALNQMIVSAPNITRKKDISWEDKEYHEKIALQEIGVRSQPLELNRRASVGPCFRAGMPLSGPSGITICLPKKPPRNVDYSFCSMPSGINITISKRNVAAKSKSSTHNEQAMERPNEDMSENYPKREEDPFAKIFGVLRGKIDSMRGKIKNVFNM